MGIKIDMQTFLPFESFKKSAQVLDYRRLGKQRVETFQILNTLTGQSEGWKNHPAVKMWVGYEDALIAYYYEICREWVGRGYKHTLPILIPPEHYEKPTWLGDECFHRSHRSALLYKNFEFYSQYNWKETPEYNYWWPNA